MKLEEATKLICTATWEYIKDKTPIEQNRMAEAMATLLGSAKVGEYLRDMMVSKEPAGSNRGKIKIRTDKK